MNRTDSRPMSAPLPLQLLVLSAGALLLLLLGWPAGRLLLSALLWLTLPGAVLLLILRLPPLPLLLRAALSWALSLSLISLAALWLAAAGLALPPALSWLLLLLLIAACGILMLRTRPAVRPLQLRTQQLLLLLVLAVTALLRAAQISDLALPAWVDAPQHALLVRVAAEQGRAPLDLRPYLAVADLPYHWGYHVWLATAWRTSDAALSDALLWSGQLLNWLQLPAVAALALMLWRRPRAALISALIVGCVSSMPAYYVSWSRYTQLTGLLMLPGLAIAFQFWLRSRRRAWLLLTTLITVGLLLVHVRVLMFALALLLVQAGFALLDQPRRFVGSARILAAAAAGALGLAAPWLRVLFERRLAPAVSGAAPLAGGGDYIALSPGLLWAGVNELLLPLALLAALLGLAQRARGANLLISWTALLVLLTNPQLLSRLTLPFGLLLAAAAVLRRRWWWLLPAAALSAVNPWTVELTALWLLPLDSLLISLFLPVSLLIGGAFALLTERLAPRLQTAVVVLAIAAALPFAWQQRTIVNPATVLADADDRAALTWIAAQTPADARFLVNSADWMPGVPRLNDGGGWITPLSGRWTNLPPVTFVYADAATQAQVRSSAALLRAVQPGRLAALAAYLRTAAIDYVYTSARGPLTPQLLAGLPQLREVFRSGDVVIFAVIAPATGAAGGSRCC